MGLFWQITLTIFGAIFGALLSLVLPTISDYRRNRRYPELLGTWKSTYRPDFRDGTHGITEEVEIDLHFGKLRMKNHKNPSDDSYVVHAQMAQNMYIIGRWMSLKPGANAFGAIILTVSPLGNLMYGYFTGLGNTGERTYCGWALARRNEDLSKAVDLLRRNTLGISKHTTRSELGDHP
jgi:hypothetical protein